MAHRNIEKKKHLNSFTQLLLLIVALIISVPIATYFKINVFKLKLDKDLFDFAITLIMSLGVVIGIYLSYIFYKGQFEESLSGNSSSPAAIEGEFLVTITFLIAYLLLLPFFLIFKLFGQNIYQSIRFKNNILLSILAGFFCSILFCIVLSLFIVFIN